MSASPPAEAESLLGPNTLLSNEFKALIPPSVKEVKDKYMKILDDLARTGQDVSEHAVLKQFVLCCFVECLCVFSGLCVRRMRSYFDDGRDDCTWGIARKQSVLKR